MNIEEILTMEPIALVQKLDSEYLSPMIIKAETPEDFAQISEQMAKDIAYLQYLEPILAILKIKTQDLRNKKEKDEYQIMMQRRDVVDTFCGLLKTQKETLSRMITIKQLSMSTIS